MEFLFKSSAFTPPTTYWMALYTVAPTSAGGGTEVTTVNTGYVRIGLTTASFTTSGSTIKNTSAITFPSATTDYGVVVAAALHDSSVTSAASTMLIFTTISTLNVVTGQAANFPATAVHWTAN